MKTKHISIALLIFLFVFTYSAVSAQENVKLYDPSLDGMTQIKDAIGKAAKEGKHVLIQYGGNWCSWCKKFDTFCKADSTITGVISKNYIPVKLNYDPTNKNAASNVFLGNPSRFGFPVLIIVDSKGKVLHIQDSGLLEEGPGYSKEKVTRFFGLWTPLALLPEVPKAQK
jgi:thiol:disulfide interchange protein